MIQLCNTLLARSIALKKCYLLMNFEENSFYHFLNIRKNANFDCQTLIKCDFLEGQLPKYFFFFGGGGICSSGGKQTIHKISAAFIVKNCHPQTSLINPSSSDHPIWRQTIKAFDRKMKNCQG